MIGVLMAMTLALYAAAAGLLVVKHRRTRDSGVLWLALPLVVLPGVALPLTLWLHAGVDRLVRGQRDGAFPFTLVTQGHLTMGELLTLLNVVEHVVWGAFSLVAVLALRPHRAKDVPG